MNQPVPQGEQNRFHKYFRMGSFLLLLGVAWRSYEILKAAIGQGSLPLFPFAIGGLVNTGLDDIDAFSRPVNKLFSMTTALLVAIEIEQNFEKVFKAHVSIRESGSLIGPFADLAMLIFSLMLIINRPTTRTAH